MTDTATVETPSNTGTGTKDSSKKRYLILGSGPAALIAARTLKYNGVDDDHIRILSQDKKPSEIRGAQFLHRPIFGGEEKPDAVVSVARLGSAPGYAKKVYGDERMPTSFTNGEVEIDAWSLVRSYERLWEEFFPSIEEMTIEVRAFRELVESEEYDEIISTIPPQSYCSNPVHEFKAVSILLSDEPLDDLIAENVILYSGRPEDSWYRMSNLFGEQGIEFGSEGESFASDNINDMPQSELVDDIMSAIWTRKSIRIGRKPMGTTCDCGFNPEGKPNLLRVGRFGAWDRKVLLHQVQSQVASIL